MRRSISTKLIIAFLSIGIVSAAVLFLTARWSARQEFIDYLSDENNSSVITQLTEYYLVNGSWVQVGTIFVQQQPSYDHRPALPFALADTNGIVVFSNGKYKPGDKLSESDMASGTPIKENGQTIGIYVPLRMPFQGRPRELEFIERINMTLLYGALIGAVLALVLGVIISRTLTRPLRELTQATHAISEGDLSQQVPVRTKDEMGELAQAFNRMSAELSRSVNVRKQMTADIAHELRTPLSLIIGHAEAVHDGVLPPTAENFEIIREEATRLEHLVNDLRTLSLADAGELTIAPQIIEPDRLINEVASVFQYETRKKNISLEVNVTPPLSTIEADPGRMTQVLTNILDNATRHTPEGGRITISTRQVGDNVELAIQDSGPGVPAEVLERIFERFYRTDSSRQRDGETGGSGLGLAIAKSIVQAHGGQLSAESEPGQGLKIIISLPGKS
jgi:signal transduction histidine kinase